MSEHAHAHEHSHHITPLGKLVTTGLWLALLMATTIAWAFFAPQVLGNTPLSSVINNLVALGIACLKAWLVIQIFMGVKFQSNVVKTYAILGFVWVTLMFTMFADYGTRQWEPVQGWTPGDTQQAMPRADQPYEEAIPPRSKINIPEGKH